MFSFIKFFQSLTTFLKRKKWLWFSILSFGSATGVLISMLFINMMTSDVAKQTYLEEHRLDINLLGGFMTSRYDSLLSIGNILAIKPEIINHIKQKEDKTLVELLDATSKNINEKINISPLSIKYYAAEYEASISQNHEYADLVMSSKQNITGVAVNKDGVRLLSITPVVDNNITVGAIEVSQSIHALKEDFERIDKEFIFILNKNQLVFLDIEHKTDTYSDIDEEYKIAFHNYDSKFYTNLQRLKIADIRTAKYANNKNFYTTYDETYDLNGREIGLFFIGQSSSNANSFVKITENMIKSVTMVALGLVISLILFMF